MRDWMIKKDMNSDGIFTISDVGEILYFLFFYPGDLVIYLMIGTRVGIFFEFSSTDYGGFFSGIFSLFVWGVVVLGIYAVDEDWFKGQNEE